MMLEKTDSRHAPWYIVRSDDKRRGRLNCISHILSMIPYEKISRAKVKLPQRSNKRNYDDQASLTGRKFVAMHAEPFGERSCSCLLYRYC